MNRCEVCAITEDMCRSASQACCSTCTHFYRHPAAQAEIDRMIQAVERSPYAKIPVDLGNDIINADRNLLLQRLQGAERYKTLLALIHYEVGLASIHSNPRMVNRHLGRAISILVAEEEEQLTELTLDTLWFGRSLTAYAGHLKYHNPGRPPKNLHTPSTNQ